MKHGQSFKTMAITINGSTGVQLEDNDKQQFGTGDDLQIYHNGSSSFISDEGTGSLKITTNGTGVDIQKGSSETIARFIADGACELYNDNSKKFHTYSGGCSVFGNLNLEDNDRLRLGDGSDLQIWHDGTTNIIEGLDGNMSIRPKTGENGILLRNNGSVDLYYDDVKKFETTSDGATFSGSVLINNSNGVNVYGSISMTETSTYGWLKSFSGKGLYLVPTSNGVYLDSGDTSWNSGSDERTKTDLTPITDALTKIEGCRSVIGRYKTDEKTTERSFLIAQDFQTHFPVAVGKNKTLPDDENLSLRYQDVIPLLLAGIKELSSEVKTLKTKVAALEAA